MTNFENLFLDASSLMEILFNREKVEEILLKTEQSNQVYISTLSVHLAFHFGRKERIIFEDIEFLIDKFNILDFTQEDYRLAKVLMQNNDFEDALQLATAQNNNIKNILSLDKDMIQTYKNQFSFV